MTEAHNNGMVVLVATPIGNLGDLTARAREVLETADVIYCEDTRHTRILLSALDIGGGGRLRTLNAHSESALAPVLVSLVGEGKLVALVCDAGMPAISDPGHALVRAAHDAGITVTVAPGASSVLGALVISGLETDRFCFEGFLPRKGRAREHRLVALEREERTTVLFESPQRLCDTLDEFARVLGSGREVAVVRELTKKFEEVKRGRLDLVAAHFRASDVRGEIVIVLGGAAPASLDVIDLDLAIDAGIEAGERLATLASRLAHETGATRQQVYDRALARREQHGAH